jgi:hypothetical protein
MMNFMFNKARLLQVVCWMVTVLLSPAMALAADDDKLPDARIQNFTKPVSLPDSNNGLTWLFLIFLAVVCLGAMFKNAKRTHLD